MQRLLFAAVLAASATLTHAQPQMEPGEWEFVTTVTSPGMPTPQTMTMLRCIKKEDVADPMSWSGNKQSDCKVTSKSTTADRHRWEVSCPSSGMRGAGSVRVTQGKMESEMKMTGSSAKGQSFDMMTKTQGRRVGPCKS